MSANTMHKSFESEATDLLLLAVYAAILAAVKFGLHFALRLFTVVTFPCCMLPQVSIRHLKFKLKGLAGSQEMCSR